MKKTLKWIFSGLLLAIMLFVAFKIGQSTSLSDELNIDAAAAFVDLKFTQQEKDSMLPELKDYQQSIKRLHQQSIPNSLGTALAFDPVVAGMRFETTQKPIEWGLVQSVALPADKSELALYSVADLSVLIKTKKISSEELTKIFIERLKKYGNQLECIITLMEEQGLAQARKADEEIAQGKYRGPLHGIPYGVKDLFAVKGTKTTWGAEPYVDQEINETATVVNKLNEAGAVLIAKLTLGALAMGDVWYGGTTKNPWNLEEGSSGSSAGSASAVASALLPFAIGTETYGSIVSPSTRCGITGLRPTFGRVSRHGAMALCWSLDKVGPMARSAEDAALVFASIYGPDDKDLTVKDLPFNYDPQLEVKSLKIAYLKDLFEEKYSNKKNDSLALLAFEKMGVKLIPASFKTEIPVNDLIIILSAEAAAAFDDLTRNDQDDLLKRQGRNAWPNFFRSARFIPAVEFVQANRLRQQLMQEMNEFTKQYDVVVMPTFAGDQLWITNLTGHPMISVPNGFNQKGSPTSFCMIANLYDEARLLTVAKAWQENSGHKNLVPKAFGGK